MGNINVNGEIYNGRRKEMTERWEEIRNEIFDMKTDLFNEFDKLNIKLDKLIIARDFDKSEPKVAPVPIGMPIMEKQRPTPVKKESTKKGAGPQDQKIITERKKGEKTRRKVVKVSSTLCKKCQGHISWDDYETTGRPIHVDINGFVMGNGDCPKWEDNHE